MSESIGKKAEHKIREWLNRPEDGYYFWRLPDQTFGISGPTGSNPCDFFLFKSPEFYLIESKATEHDNFPFSMLTDYQHESLTKASLVEHVHGVVIVLFVTYQRAFLLDIKDINAQIEAGHKSLNITKIKKWKIPYKEIKTVPNSRKSLLDYDTHNNVL